MQPPTSALSPGRTRAAAWAFALLAASLSAGCGGGSDSAGATTPAVTAGGGGASAAAPPATLGSGTGATEQRVNGTTTGDQLHPVAASLRAGGQVIVWGAGPLGVCSQRYAASGQPAGGERCLGAGTAFDTPSVAGLADGGYLVAWTGVASGAVTVQSQRFAADGTPRGAVVQVNAGVQVAPDDVGVAGLADGGYVVSWKATQLDGSAFGIFARRYDAAGVAVAVEQPVSALRGVDQLDPAVAALDGGDYVVAWTSLFRESDGGANVYAQRFNGAGAPVGPERRVNATLAGSQRAPALAGVEGGGFVVAWEAAEFDGTFNGNFIVFQRFAADGLPVGPETRVDRPATPDTGPCLSLPLAPCPYPQQAAPALAALADGGFVIAWSALLDRTQEAQDVFARRYGRDGAVSGPPVRVSSPIGASQVAPTVAAAGSGGFVIAWQAWAQDGDGWGVYARRFDVQGLRGATGPSGGGV